MPSGLHGLPQWNLPPMNSYAVRWPWASSVPETSPSRVAPLNAGPLAPAVASGKRAHTPVRTNENRPSCERTDASTVQTDGLRVKAVRRPRGVR